jgi:septum formation protein
MPERPQIILASASGARQSMLRAAGVAFDVVPADVDEAAIRTEMVGKGSTAEPVDVASVLAMEKALAVSRDHLDALVIGSDQVLAMHGRIYSKAANVQEANETLKSLRGGTHELVSAVALAKGGNVVWQAFDSAEMTMRNFTDAFLESYLEDAGARAVQSVGCYQLEGLGIQLFERVDGDYFTVLGMPLLPLLAELRAQGLVMS